MHSWCTLVLKLGFSAPEIQRLTPCLRCVTQPKCQVPQSHGLMKTTPPSVTIWNSSVSILCLECGAVTEIE
jgi:hypothetical protein